MKFRGAYTWLITVLVVSSCTKDVGLVNTGNYPDDIDAIITKNCAVSGCHNSASKDGANGLNLETWETMFEGSTTGSPVIPYSSKFSSLCYFINTYPELGTQNAPTMPLNKSPLSFGQVERIRNWIDAGAPDKNGDIKWADNPSRKKFYAVNQGCDVVTVFDAESRLPMRFVQVGKGGTSPHQVRVSPDGKFWYVIFINRNVMLKFSCADDQLIGEIPLTPLAAGTGIDDAQDWNTFNISEDGKWAYVVSWTQNGHLTKVDLVNRKFVRMIGGLYYPHAIALSPGGKSVFVASQGGNYVSEIDSSLTNFKTDYALDGTSAVNSPAMEPHDMIFSPGGNELWIVCQKTNEVRVFDLATKTIKKVITTPLYPQEIIYSEVQKNYYVTCMGTGGQEFLGAVSCISAGDFSVKNLTCGSQPHGLAEDKTSGQLYVLSRNVSTNGPIPHHSSQCNGRNGFVNFIDLRTFTVLKQKIELSVDPYFISSR